MPFVIAWNYREDGHTSYVGFDNKSAARTMAERVFGYGHRNIAMIAGVTTFNDRAADRVAGVREALKIVGIAPERLPIIEARYALETGAQAFAQLMTGSPQPTATLCGNDVLAAGALVKAKEMGIRIPRDISITGFNDIDLAEAVEPQLTTIHVPHKRMGRAAAQLLLASRDGNAAHRSVKLDTYVIERDSLGAVANR